MLRQLRRFMCIYGKDLRGKDNSTVRNNKQSPAYFNFRELPNYIAYFDNDGCRSKSRSLFSSCVVEDACDSTTIGSYLSNVEDKPTRREFVVFGRSNVGKSSLVNSLFYGSQAAETSKKPGKTQHLHFYRLNDQDRDWYLVDSPGYGFANNASKQQMDSWKYMINTYLKSQYVHRAICLFDSEHGLKPTDRMLMRLLDKLQRSYILVATKSDKKTTSRASLEKLLEEHPFMNSYVHLTSCRANTGLDELRSHITYMCPQPLTNIPK